MATYAIGDIQGCFDPFMRLLHRIAFDPTVDELWLAGDLVNRGPRNVDVLRWCIDHEPRLRVVLGNHDLHLIAADAGLREARGRDTLQDVLQAPHRRDLVDFLWRQPLLHERDGFVMVHAGVPPTWDLDTLRIRARRLRAAMDEDRERFLTSVLAPETPAEVTLAGDLGALTRMRTVDRTGRPVYGFAGAPEDAPPGERPWFDAPRRAPLSARVLFGHWAAAGLRVRWDMVALDSGCVWGNQLSAFRLDDGQVFQVSAAL